MTFDLTGLSLVSFAWFFCTVWVSLGALFVKFPSLVPPLILNLYIYGKVRSTKSVKLKKASYLLPKSFFSHFYFAGCVVITTSLCLTVYVMCGGAQLPDVAKTIITAARYPTKESYGDMFSALLVLACADFQVFRRFLECLCVSIYSPDSKMSIVIYVVGVSFYTALPLTIVAGTELNTGVDCTDMFYNICWNHIFGLALFLWASWNQHVIAKQFAKLRQDKSGNIQDTKHHIPHGGLFEYVSCPHYFCEILIYFSMNVMFAFQNTMMVWLFIFVLVNQLISGHFSHVWYRERFPKYPKSRKSTIPYVF